MLTLKSFRMEKSLSKEKMARIIGVSLSFFEKVESGHVSASRGFMKKLKSAYPETNIDMMFFSEVEAGESNGEN